MQALRVGRVMLLLIRRSMCSDGPAPGGGESPSIGKKESPGGGFHCLSEVRNFILDVSKDVSWTPIRGGVESNVRARGRSRAARMGSNLVGHLELSAGRRARLAIQPRCREQLSQNGMLRSC